jgi:hypothetical protein
MQDVNVVVVFYGDSMEPLALAAAVGAVQGRANIRLRRLDPATGFDMEYIAPREADAEWGEAILLGMDSITENFAQYLEKCRARIIERIGGADGLEAARLQGRKVADMARSQRRAVIQSEV